MKVCKDCIFFNEETQVCYFYPLLRCENCVLNEYNELVEFSQKQDENFYMRESHKNKK